MEPGIVKWTAIGLRTVRGSWNDEIGTLAAGVAFFTLLAIFPGIAAVARQVESVVHVGATWTTDAPFRETERAIEAARALGVLAVEMEAAGLYAFARARGRAVLCLAHVTNAMAQAGDDFEKGEDNGARDALRILTTLANALERPTPGD